MSGCKKDSPAFSFHGRDDDGLFCGSSKWSPPRVDLAVRECARMKALTTRITDEQCDDWISEATAVADGFESGEISTPGRPFAIFTSAGNHNNVKAWLENDGHNTSTRKWDLIVHSYADCDNATDESELRSVADVFVCSKGSKWGSLDEMYQANHSLVSSYLCVGVLDDDAHGIDMHQLNELCEILLREKLIILAPAVTGHMLYPGAHPVPNSDLRRSREFDMGFLFWSVPWLQYYLSMRETRLNGSHEQIYIKNLLGFSKRNHNDCVNQFFAISDRIVFDNPDVRDDGVREWDRAKSLMTPEELADLDAIGQEMSFLEPFGFDIANN